MPHSSLLCKLTIYEIAVCIALTGQKIFCSEDQVIERTKELFFQQYLRSSLHVSIIPTYTYYLPSSRSFEQAVVIFI